MTILRLKDVADMLKLSKATILRKAKEGTFPTPIKIGARAIGFFGEEIDEWVYKQSQKRNLTKVNSPKGVK